jgi:hypothetical protein
VEPAVAFDVFTNEIDLWWRRGIRFRPAGRGIGQLCFEPGVGGRVFETLVNKSGTTITYQLGLITVWDPPSRFVLEWRLTNFAPNEKTELEVVFQAATGGTQVIVIHRGWASIRPDHPARHGMDGGAFTRMMGLWWGDLMTALREFIADKRSDL